MPFATEGTSSGSHGKKDISAPWTATTPQGRLPMPKISMAEDKEQEAEQDSEKMEEARKQLQKLKELMGKDLPQDAFKTLEKATMPGETNLRHSHLAKADKAKRLYQTARDEVLRLDSNWKTFRSILKERYESQQKAYSRQREEAMKQMEERKAEWLEAKAKIEKIVGSNPEEEEEELLSMEDTQKMLMELDKQWQKSTEDAETISIPEDEEMDSNGPAKEPPTKVQKK